MSLLKKDEKKVYNYKIQFKNGQIDKGQIITSDLKKVWAALFKKEAMVTNNAKKLFYWNSDEFIKVEVTLE